MLFNIIVLYIRAVLGVRVSQAGLTTKLLHIFFAPTLRNAFQAYTTQAWQYRQNVKRYTGLEHFKHAEKDI